MPVTPVIAVPDLELQPRPEAWLPPPTAQRRFHIQRATVGAQMGLSKLGCTVTEVGPGAVGYPFHSHRANEELFYILSGHGELRLGRERHAVKAGDLIGCPTGGPETAHQLVNTGDAPLRYIAISTLIDPDVCEYPDSGKVGAFAKPTGDDPGTGLMHLSHYDANLDYWVGE